MSFQFIRIRDVRAPERAEPGSAGIDFYIPNDFEPNKKIMLHPGRDILIPSGIKVRLPEGKGLVFLNRSGMASKKKLVIGAQLVDQSYQGEIHFHIISFNSIGVHIEPAMKLMQGIVIDIDHSNPVEKTNEEELYKNFVSERGDRGFGSSDNEEEEEKKSNDWDHEDWGSII